MTLSEFLKSYNHLELVSDSRKAKADSLYVAIKGTSHDGHKFLEQVYKQGCRHFIIEDNKALENLNSIKYIKVKSTRSAWAYAWKTRSDHLLQNSFLCAVTGTNGKTSITMMIEHILNFCEVPCAVMGTIDHHFCVAGQNKVWPSNLTTPGAEVLYPRLAEMKQLGAQAVAMEISSHALDQNRAEGLDLNTAIFSNLTEDHLDYHPNLQHYFESKLKLYKSLLKDSNKNHKVAILNYMDKWVSSYCPDFVDTEILIEVSHKDVILDSSKNLKQLDAYKAAQQKNPKVKLNVLCLVSHSSKGLEFKLYLDVCNSDKKDKFSEHLSFNLPVMGHFQALNWCQAVLASLVYFTGPKNLQSQENQKIAKTEVYKKVMNSALTFTGVPGRLQKVLTEKPKSVFVDYAHTPDALERTLKSVKDVCLGKVILVFGCGGDRDRLKRPLMAEVATNFSDIQIVTNDNPRTENPEDILFDILAGFRTDSYDFQDLNVFENLKRKSDLKHVSASKVKIELDRRLAIQKGLQLLKSPEDILLIAGKGHESYQILKNETIDFSDYQIAHELIESQF